MSNKRIKLSRPALKSRAEAEAVLGEVRALTISRNATQAKREKELQAVDDRYAGQLDELAQTMDEKVELLRGWAEGNPSEFGGKKSLDLTHGLMGWRIGQPTLKTLSGFTWDRVLEKIRTVFAEPAEFIRTKHEVDKQALLAQRDTIPAENLKAIGVRVVQDEPFFVEPKLDEPEPTRLREAA
jgi:phage host-nuclease inhibitor protein Gam